MRQAKATVVLQLVCNDATHVDCAQGELQKRYPTENATPEERAPVWRAAGITGKMAALKHRRIYICLTEQFLPNQSICCKKCKKVNKQKI